jgi:hypothetical protein
MGRFHVKHRCHIVSFDDVLIEPEILNRGKQHRQESDHDVPPARGGTRGPSKLMSIAKGIVEISFPAKPFRYASTNATF